MFNFEEKKERVFFNRNLLVSLLSGKSRAIIKTQNPRHLINSNYYHEFNQPDREN